MLYIFFLAGYLTGMALTFWMLEFDTACRWWNNLVNLFKRKKWTLAEHLEKMHDLASKISKVPESAMGSGTRFKEKNPDVSIACQWCGHVAPGHYRTCLGPPPSGGEHLKGEAAKNRAAKMKQQYFDKIRRTHGT